MLYLCGRQSENVGSSVLKKNAPNGHFPAAIEGSKRKKCRNCSSFNERRDTRYYCRECQVPLCILCFQQFHGQQ